MQEKDSDVGLVHLVVEVAEAEGGSSLFALSLLLVPPLLGYPWESAQPQSPPRQLRGRGALPVALDETGAELAVQQPSRALAHSLSRAWTPDLPLARSGGAENRAKMRFP